MDVRSVARMQPATTCYMLCDGHKPEGPGVALRLASGPIGWRDEMGRASEIEADVC